MDYADFMEKERQVIDCLMDEHELEEDVVMNLIEEHGDQLREFTLLGFEADAIANDIARYVSK